MKKMPDELDSTFNVSTDSDSMMARGIEFQNLIAAWLNALIPNAILDLLTISN